MLSEEWESFEKLCWWNSCKTNLLNQGVGVFNFLLYYSSLCPPFESPISGVQKCEDWGIWDSFKGCRIEYDKALKLSQEVPEFYVCGAFGALT